MTMSACSDCGARGADSMEDRYTVHKDLTQTNKKNGAGVHVLGVFDGHGGIACAEYCAQHLLCQLHHSWSALSLDRSAASVASALKSTFVSLDYNFMFNNFQTSDNSGCTAIVALMVGKELHVASVGDCRAIVSRNGKAHALCTDHNADNNNEKARILMAGGKIYLAADNTNRVNGQIQVTRSIGDRLMKKHGLISEPSVQKYTISDDDEFLILATDGVWDVISDQGAVDIAQNSAKSTDILCKRLQQAALDAGSKDNISVAVVLFRAEQGVAKLCS